MPRRLRDTINVLRSTSGDVGAAARTLLDLLVEFQEHGIDISMTVAGKTLPVHVQIHLAEREKP